VERVWLLFHDEIGLWVVSVEESEDGVAITAKAPNNSWLVRIMLTRYFEEAWALLGGWLVLDVNIDKALDELAGEMGKSKVIQEVIYADSPSGMRVKGDDAEE